MQAELKSGEAYQTVSLNGDYVARVWGIVRKVEQKPIGWWMVVGKSCSAFLYVDEVTMDGKPWAEGSKLEVTL